MARARKCDRCGNFYEHYKGCKKNIGNKNSNGIELIDRNQSNYPEIQWVYDLFPECMQKLIEFLEEANIE